MENRSNKLLIIGLSIVLSLFLISFSENIEAATFGEYEYQLINRNTAVEITKYHGLGVDIVIPCEIEGRPVTSIGNDAFSGNRLTSVTIPESVTNIGGRAFYNNLLTGIVIPENVTNVGSMAFYNNLLTSIVIPENVTSIGSSAFSFNLLTSIVIPENVTSIGSDAFSHNKLTSVTIPEGITSIVSYAFRSNQLTNVTIPESVTSIGDGAFSNNQLTIVTIPEGVTNIGDSTFYNNLLTSIVIPENVTSIGRYVYACNKLTSVTIPEGVISIGDSAFYSNKLINVTIPESAINIGDWAFSGNQLTSVTIPEGVISIGDSAFYSNKLTSIVIPESVTSIGKSAFSSNQLTSIVIPKSVTFMGNDIFAYNQRSPEDFTIYGEIGSRAESYAKTFKHTFVPLSAGLIENIAVNGTNNKTTIDVDGGTLQMIVNILPENAFNKEVEWAVERITGEAEIDKNGLLTALKNGVVTVTATAKDGSGVKGSTNITIKNQTEWDVWEPKYNIVPNKVWTVEFNKILDIDTIKEKNIYVTNQNGQILPMFYYQRQQDIDKVIYIVPVKDYQSGQTYTLWIKDLKAEDGTILSKNVKMEFRIR